MHVRRVKQGTPATHPLTGRELRALRRLEREAAGSPFVFVSERGAPFAARGFQAMVERAGKAAGFDMKIHPHMLRHACGSAMLRSSEMSQCEFAFRTNVAVDQLLFKMVRDREIKRLKRGVYALPQDAGKVDKKERKEPQVADWQEENGNLTNLTDLTDSRDQRRETVSLDGEGQDDNLEIPDFLDRRAQI